MARDRRDLRKRLGRALQAGLVTGLAGASAMVLQVLFLMPVDTTITMQYRYGQSTVGALKSLWGRGGYGRFYCGVIPALVQGPAARFGDTFSNGFVSALFIDESLPTMAKTAVASGIAAFWRVLIMPVDVCKTIFQIYGQEKAKKRLWKRAQVHGLRGFYFGSLASFVSAFCGHLPWYATFNFLDRHLPKPKSTQQELSRHAVLGFSASFASDATTNSIRVLKALRQSEGLTYTKALTSVIKHHGALGLLTRGLKTRLIANGLQGIFFTILWKNFEARFGRRKRDD